MSEQNQFIEQDKIKTEVSTWILAKRLWPFIKKYSTVFYFSVVSVLVLSILGRTSPFLIGYAIDKGIRAGSIEVIRKVALIFFCVEAFGMILGFFQSYLFQRLGNRVNFDLRMALLRKTQNLHIDYFNRNPTGRTVTRLTNDVGALGDFFSEGLIGIFTQIVILVAILISMMTISWKLTLITIALTPIFVYLSYLLNKQIKESLQDQKKKHSAVNSYLAESLNGIKVVQLYNRTESTRRKFDQFYGEYIDANIKSMRAYALMQPVTNLMNACVVGSALYFSGASHFAGGIELGLMVTFMMNAQDFLYPVRDIIERMQSFQNSITSAERVFTLLDEKDEQGIEELSNRTEKPNFKIPMMQPLIEFKNLNFQYSENLPLVLKNISCVIKSGESIGLVGRTGSGKSTFISLLQNFYRPQPKSLVINGAPIENIDQNHLRSHVGVIQQDAFVFRGTIGENVSLNNPTITAQRIQWALDQVGYWELLQRTGRDLDSKVEEKGANLSSGERQLLCFARILAYDPEILILDEATANIDSMTEKIVQAATQKVTVGRTSIIIAHRLSTIENCDRIFVLNQGEIVESGSHHELLKLNGAYAKLSQQSHHLAESGL